MKRDGGDDDDLSPAVQKYEQTVTTVTTMTMYVFSPTPMLISTMVDMHHLLLHNTTTTNPAYNTITTRDITNTTT